MTIATTPYWTPKSLIKRCIEYYCDEKNPRGWKDDEFGGQCVYKDNECYCAVGLALKESGIKILHDTWNYRGSVSALSRTFFDDKLGSILGVSEQLLSRLQCAHDGASHIAMGLEGIPENHYIDPEILRERFLKVAKYHNIKLD